MTDLTALWISGMVMRLRTGGYTSPLDARADYEILEVMLKDEFNPGRLFWTAMCVMSGAVTADDEWDKSRDEMWQARYPVFDSLSPENPAYGTCVDCGYTGIIGFVFDSATAKAERICSDCAMTRMRLHAQLN